MTQYVWFHSEGSEGTTVEEPQKVEIIDPEPDAGVPTSVLRLSCLQDEDGRKKLLETVQLQDVPEPEAEQLFTIVGKFTAFSNV